MTKLNDYLPGSVTDADIDNYGSQLHFKLCSLMDSGYYEGHEYDKNGKCLCGVERPSENVTLEVTYNDRNATNPSKSKVKKNSGTMLVAASKGTDKFVKWEYRLLNGASWHDLSSYSSLTFNMPDSVRVNGVYERLTAPKLTLKAEHYGADGLLFSLQYVLPTGFTAKNAVVVYGDNHMLRYMTTVRSNTPGSEPATIFGIDIPNTGSGDGENIRYVDRFDSILSTLSKATLRNKMLRGEAVNIPGYNDAGYKKAQNLGQLTGTVSTGYTEVKDLDKGDHYFYIIGWVEYTDSSNAKKMAVVGPIAVTYNSTSSAVTDEDAATVDL